ncbi:MAG: metallophosphoesterase [Saprospiraceae bacterium]
MKKRLEIGYNFPVLVREEQLFNSDFESFSIMYLSDFHFNKYNGNLVLPIIKIIQQYDPAILLLGGDYVDTKGGFCHFTRLLYALSMRKNVFAVAGNHDYFYGINAIKESMLNNNIQWVEQSSVIISIKDIMIQIDGNKLSNDKNDSNCFKILCLHKPLNIKSITNNYHVAFAGHLHGCQCVLWENDKGLYPGRLFYPYNVLKTNVKNFHFYVSRGLSDTLPIRYNCSREAVLVRVGNDHN